jgi:hypothetical protein
MPARPPDPTAELHAEAPRTLDLTLQTTCNVRLTGVSNSAGGTTDVCDPTGGFAFTQQSLDNFGKIISKRGRRIIEFAVKFYF